MKKLLITFALTIAFVLAFSLQISEFIVTPTSAEIVEIYNETGSSIEMSDYSIALTGLSSADTVTLAAGALASGSYASFDPVDDLGSSVGLSNNGMTIALLDSTGTAVDEINYGSSGKVPAPIYNWSTARVSSTGDDAVDFNIDPTPTIGTANDAASTALGTGTVFFNEVYPDSANGDADQFIELYNSGSSSVDISDWCIVCGDDYYFPASTTIEPDSYIVVNAADFPTYFYMDYDYEHLYLFDASMQRVDQIGWDYVSTGESFSCMPNGDRSVFDGYNDATTTDFIDTLPTKGSNNSPGLATYTVMGTVGLSDNPADSSGSVVIVGELALFDTTDAHGYYEFSGLADSTYTFIFTHEGYTPDTIVQAVSSDDTINTTLIKITYDITGTVGLSDNPADSSGSIVEISELALFDTTDAHGYYEFLGLEEGIYTLYYSHDGYTPDTVIDTLDADHAISITLTALTGISDFGKTDMPVISGINTAKGLSFIYNKTDNAPSVVALFDMTGRKVFSRTISKSGAMKITAGNLDVSGIYFIRIIESEKTYTRKVLLVR